MIVPWYRLPSTNLIPIVATRSLAYGNVLVTALIAAVIGSLIKGWNGNVMMGTRLIVAMARAGALPDSMAHVSPRYGSPARAVIAILVANIVGLFLGKGGVLPILDTCAMVLTLTYVMSCAAVLKLRLAEARAQSRKANIVGPAIGLAGSTMWAAVAFTLPLVRPHQTIPLQFVILIGWSFAGLVAWWLYARRSMLGYAAAPGPASPELLTVADAV